MTFGEEKCVEQERWYEKATAKQGKNRVGEVLPDLQ